MREADNEPSNADSVIDEEQDDVPAHLYGEQVSRPMSQNEAWSLSLGRWWGVHVRLHMFFLLFATFTMYLAWHDTSGDELMLLATLSAVTLLMSVVAHELGHVVVAKQFGGFADTIVLGPLGGLQPVRVPYNRGGEFWAVVAGPLTSLLICTGCFLLISLQAQEFNFGLLLPLAPSDLINDVVNGNAWNGSTVLRLACWVNCWLFVVNLIPAFPFDGGQACLAMIRLLRPKMEQEHAVTIVSMIARIVAMGLLILALFANDTFATSRIPSWLPLVLLAIFVFFSARKEEHQAEFDDEEDVVFGYDFSQGYTSLERSTDEEPDAPPQGTMSRWMESVREKRERQRRSIEAAEDKQVDSILERLHQHGMESLSIEERSLLRRVSARYRSREGK